MSYLLTVIMEERRKRIANSGERETVIGAVSLSRGEEVQCPGGLPLGRSMAV